MSDAQQSDHADPQLEARVTELENHIARLEDFIVAEMALDEVPHDDRDEDRDEDSHEPSIIGVGEITEGDDRPHAKAVIADVEAEYEATDERGAPVDAAIESLHDAGYDDASDQIDRLRRQGEIYNPTDDRLKVV